MDKVRVAIATAGERDAIYALRHAVYAAELGQHEHNEEGRLTDALDDVNEYIVATIGAELVGFISVTPPGHGTYSVDKYFARSDMAVRFDSTLHEVRLLTVPSRRRGRSLAVLLMYAAFRWIEARGGTQIVALGRRELRDFYAKAGLRRLGPQVRSGAVTYELMSATLEHLREGLARFARLLGRLEKDVAWELGIPFGSEGACYHGGAFFSAVGESFQTMERSAEVVNADVLDAWFPPAPGAVRAVQEYLPWLLRTSPPLDAKGLVAAIAEARGIPAESIAVGAGSSSLIYLAFREWLTQESRVLLPDPTYGEYAHVLEQVIGCRVDRLRLSRQDGFRIDPGRLGRRLQEARYDLLVLVNPNNPTGRLLSRGELEPVLAGLPAHTRAWVDEAYIDYAGSDESVEVAAAASDNVMVCKSLSKAYALSGARAAYLCGPPALARALRRLTPPWAVSLPAQVAAVAALHDPGYYAQRYQETTVLRQALATRLREAVPRLAVYDSAANFLLCELPADGPDAATVCERCRARDVYLREFGEVSTRLGRRALRIAVKDAGTNQRVVEVLAEAIAVDPTGRWTTRELL